MKKINKNILVIGLSVFFLSASLILLAKAQETELFFFSLLKYTQDFKINDRQGDGTVASTAKCLDNIGSINYFIPNKIKTEIDSFLARVTNDAVSGVSIDNICVNGACEPANGENAQNNPDDCSTSYCGDSVCDGNETCACADCPACQTFCGGEEYNDCPLGLPDRSDCIATPDCLYRFVFIFNVKRKSEKLLLGLINQIRRVRSNEG